MSLFFFLAPIFSLFGNLLDLEDNIQSFVLETRRLEIPEYPDAFNPSIIRWKGHILMSFRVIPDPQKTYDSQIGLIWLTDDFCQISEPQILNLRESLPNIPSRAEDARLISVGDRLYMVYDDNQEEKLSRGGFRVYLAELLHDGEKFYPANIECLSRFEGESRAVREKSWTPFNYMDELYLAYTLSPHKIFKPLFKDGECITVCSTETPIEWPWGELRGGTPALEIDGEYLAFFHSSTNMETIHSQGKNIAHYFIGAHTFSSDPPFQILRASPEPIIGRGFYHGYTYKPYWKPIRAVFPCGLIADDDHFWIAYGRQDHEIWIAKIDKKGLLDSLKTLQH
ncbi:MAG: hypothetical protein A3E80_04955 [Chlamydiae bacterium RIFCSPHIGHO2_12_FULL_49_9]|nr:MAG: hypothetical protein A3E80_04955 [Chlamydiae bacterium RIFCSPHIGHO2_12_FULL_49_9]